MGYDEEFFKSEEFQDLLKRYESSVEEGNPLFLDSDDYVDIADYYNYTGNYDKAEELVDRGLEYYPNDTLLNVFKARQALADNDFELAEKYAETIEDKDAPDYHYLKAEIMIAKGQKDNADDYLVDLLSDMPTDELADYIKDVANLYLDYDNDGKAYEWMMRSQDDKTDDFKELMGRALLGIGKYKDSQKMFNELIDQDPYSTKYWNALASAQYLDQDYNAAVTSSEYALAIDPKDPQGLLSKANGLYQLGNYKDAIEFFTRYLDVAEDIDNDTLVHIFEEMALSYSEIGNTEEALKTLDETSDLECDANAIKVVRAHILLTAGRNDEAAELFGQAVLNSNADPDIVVRCVVSMLDNGLVEESYTSFKAFLSEDKNRNIRTGHAYMALCCYELGKDKEFLKYLNKSVEYNPVEARTVLGSLYPKDMQPSEYYEKKKKNLKNKK